MPGPLLTLTIAQTAKRGFLAAVFIVLGHSLLELVIILGLAFGLGRFLGYRPVLGAVTLLGGGVLLWIGSVMMLDSLQGGNGFSTGGFSKPTHGSIGHPFFMGMTVSLSNPYWTIWWATIGMTFFAALARNAAATIAAFYFGHIFGDIVWYIFVGAAVSGGRRIMRPTVYRLIVTACGVFLIFLGVMFICLVVSGKLWAVKFAVDWIK